MQQRVRGIADPDLFFDLNVVHQQFRALRARDPVHWTGDGGYWSITRYDHIVEISKRPDVFSSALEHGGVTIAEDAEPTVLTRSASMITMNPPKHNRYRNLFAPQFANAAIQSIEHRIRRHVGEIFDGLDSCTVFDWVASVSAELPSRVLADLLGVPFGERHKFSEWVDLIDGLDDPEFGGDHERLRSCMEEMRSCGLRLREARLARPQCDLISIMAHSTVDGQAMSIDRFLAMFAMFIVAGSETVRNAVAGGVVALSEHPQQRQLLVESPRLVVSAVDEINRWVTPIYHMRRTALDDYEIAGKHIRRGDKVVLWYLSANRDERAFAQPLRFDVWRSEKRHLSFGAGQHLCIGWRLAELQMICLFQELLRRYPRFVVCGPAAKVRSNFISGFKSLPVRLSP